MSAMSSPHALASRSSRFSSQMNNRRSSTTSSSSASDDEITPCPLDAPSAIPQRPKLTTPANSRSRTHRQSDPLRERIWSFDASGDGTDHDQLDLGLVWQRMLAIQRVFGCYNSARMRAAVEMGVEDGLIPSRTCLDLLNESISQLPETARQQLDEFLTREDSRRSSTSSLGTGS